MDTHTSPNDPWAGGDLAAALRRAQDRIVGRAPSSADAERPIPEWVKRARAGQLVRKDMTGTVAS